VSDAFVLGVERVLTSMRVVTSVAPARVLSWSVSIACATGTPPSPRIAIGKGLRLKQSVIIQLNEKADVV
jgi:hypothetical protein